MLSKTHFSYIVFFSLIVILLNGFLFTDMSVDPIFLFSNFIVVLISVECINYCQMSYTNLKERVFIKRIFWFSLWLRIFAVVFYYFLFYYITDTEFDVEPIDAAWYDEIAKTTAISFLNGSFSFTDFLVDIRGSVDDSGYILFLSLIYSTFNNGVLIARIFQAIISAGSVVLIYRISKEIFDDKTGRLSAILMASFQPFLLYTSIHMKETLMIYFLLLFIYQCVKLVSNKSNLRTIVILIFSLITLFTFRTVLGLIAFASLLGYLMVAGGYSFNKKIVILLLLGAILSFLTVNFMVFNEIAEKAGKYAGVETEDKSTAGGRSVGQVASSQSFAKYAGGGVFLLQSMVMPYPSMVRTNIVLFDQTLQWYYGGGLLVWVFLSFYSYIGLYNAIKKYFRRSMILISILFVYTIALISSLYITSIRFNMVKIALLIPFVAFGIVSAGEQTKKKFFVYSAVVGLIVILWNYIKLAGRGLV